MKLNKKYFWIGTLIGLSISLFMVIPATEACGLVLLADMVNGCGNSPTPHIFPSILPESISPSEVISVFPSLSLTDTPAVTSVSPVAPPTTLIPADSPTLTIITPKSQSAPTEILTNTPTVIPTITLLPQVGWK